MDKINVVTGATGHIGFALCAELKKRGEYVRAIYKNESKSSAELAKIVDETVACDVYDREKLSGCFENADTVFHLAGLICLSSGVNDDLIKINVDGTRNVCEACLEKGVRKLVYTSTGHTVPFQNRKELLIEPERFSPDKVAGGYAKSKAIASNIVLDFAAKGLDAVLALPTGVVGEYEYRRSSFGQMIADVAEKKLPALVTGRYDFVDVKDVASALIDLRDAGIKGESYIVSGRVMTVKELVSAAASAAGTPVPRFIFPNALVKLVAKILERIAQKRGELPMFTPYSLQVLTDNCNFSHEKLTALTGYAPRDPKEAIEEQTLFYLNNRNI